ncbi:MAG: transglutaminase-like cysteine peptidase [Epsilonproteobacteria bacterium]|nr:transglutaminase-like cysteine peptidase [Campylobacterota bacterium]
MKITALILITILIFSLFIGCVEENKNPETSQIDSDSDGVHDDIDAFPTDPAASKDSDKDGFPDSYNTGKTQQDSTLNLTSDSFPSDSAASKDSDGDGYPDSWNQGKTQADSTSIPPLELDEFPDDPNAYKDTDKDGIADSYDINSQVNLSIDITLESFQVTKRVDILRWAQIYFIVKIGNYSKTIKNNGLNYMVLLNQKTTINQVVSYDIPDNTKESFTEITISMYDSDLLKEDDLIDITSQSQKTITLLFNNIKNTVSYEKVSQGTQGILWYQINYPIANEETTILNKTYSWKYENKDYNIYLEIPEDKYDYYLNYKTSRIPQNDNTDSNSKMASFVTSSDETINILSEKLYNLAKTQGFDKTQTANFILHFVQKTIEYNLDNVTKGCTEYWRFPVETLVEQEGDCEDTSVLYASILKNLGYDSALLFYAWEENDERIGHLAVGLHLINEEGDYVTDENNIKYYYCETTAKNYNVGELPDEPPQIKQGPEEIIHL